VFNRVGGEPAAAAGESQPSDLGRAALVRPARIVPHDRNPDQKEKVEVLKTRERDSEKTERVELGGTLARLLWLEEQERESKQRRAVVVSLDDRDPAQRGQVLCELKPFDQIVVGRSPECEVQLKSSSVSRRHATLEFTALGVILSDLESRNGVLVNDVPLVQKLILRSGDRVRFGEEEVELVVDSNTDREVGELLRERAEVDGRTGLRNRGAFDRVLSREFRRAKRFDRPLGLAIIHMVKHEAFRGRYGTAMADSAIRKLAAICHQASHTDRTSGRIGSDGFAILAPEADADEMRQLAARLRSRLGAAVADLGAPFAFAVRAGELKREHRHPVDLVVSVEAEQPIS